MSQILLACSLELVVPLWIQRLRQRSWDFIQERAHACAQVVAEKGDIILFRSPKKGESAAAFNALAEGVACLSFCPGGVRLFGVSFRSTHPDSMPSSFVVPFFKFADFGRPGVNT